MSEIKNFRVNGFDPTVEKNSVEFYFKTVDDDNNILCSFVICDEGMYYYRPRSGILTPKENKNTRDTYDGFLSMENLKLLFESTIKAKLCDEDELTITTKSKTIQINQCKEKF